VRNLTRDDHDITDEEVRQLRSASSTACARITRFQERPGACTTSRPRPPRARPTGSRRRTSPASATRHPHAGTADNPYYTNSSQLPVGFTADPFLAMALQEPLQQKYTGGTVLHLYLGEAMESARACRDLVRRSLERFRLPYLTITPTFSICPRHGYVSGHHEVCPTCDAECEVWTRVMGYFRPISGSTSARRAKLRRGRTSSHPRSLGGEAMVRTLQPVN
jgi:ribonucleoside-triphosphate reductase